MEILKALVLAFKQPSSTFFALILLCVGIGLLVFIQLSPRVFMNDTTRADVTFGSALWNLMRGLVLSGPLWFVFLSSILGLYFYVEHSIAQDRFHEEIERRSAVLKPMLGRLESLESGEIQPEEYWKARLGEKLAKLVATSHRSGCFVFDGTIFFQPLHEKSANGSLKWDDTVFALRMDAQKHQVALGKWREGMGNMKPAPYGEDEVSKAMQKDRFVWEYLEGPVLAFEPELETRDRNAIEVKVSVTRPPSTIGEPSKQEIHIFWLPFYR